MALPKRKSDRPRRPETDAEWYGLEDLPPSRETGFTVRRRTPPAAYRRAARIDLVELFGLTAAGLSNHNLPPLVEESNELAAGAVHSLTRWQRVRQNPDFAARLYDYHCVVCQSRKPGEWTLLILDYETRGTLMRLAGYKSDFEAKLACYLITTEMWIATPEPAETP